MSENQVLETIMKRRSTRQYADKPVDESHVETILRAGMQAPSGHNSQPWHMLTITQRETLQAMVPFTPWWKMLQTAPLAIVVCGDMQYMEKMNREFLVESCAAASQNMVLAANSLGLGCVWLGMCVGQEHYDEMKALLGIPDGYDIMNVLSLGWPAEQKPQEDRFVPEKWHRETWGNQ